MTIDDEQKRQIIEELARGNPNLPPQQLSSNTLSNEQELDDKDYQNFDDFAQRSSQSGQRQMFSESSAQIDLAIQNKIKERITTDINQAKEVGQLRTERIREIVQSAVSQVTSEVKYGTSDIRTIVKDSVSTVIENLQEKGGEIKEEITASIEGAIEGLTNWRRQSIAKTQEEVKHLQARIATEEDELQQEIDSLLDDIEKASKDNTPSIKASVESAVNALKNSEEVAIMQKRYAQLQAQVAILKANLAARYGGRHEEVKQHLDEATTWYNQTRTKVEPIVDQTLQKKEQLEEKLGAAGTAVAKKERKIRQILSDLLALGAELLREKENPAKK